MRKIDLFLFYFMIISIIGVISLILKLLKIDDLFVLTFFFLGSIIITSGNYDCFPPAIPGTNGWYLPLFEFWFWLGGVIPLTFFLGFIVLQNTYAEINKERTLIYGILIIGIMLLSIPLENFSIYLYRGLEYFSPSYSCYQTIWFNGIFPIYYFIAIPGIILISYAFIWSVKNREVGEK